MSFESIISLGVTMILAFVSYIFQKHMTRLDKLEESMQNKITDGQARQILDDRLEPVKEKLDEVKDSLDQLYLLLLKK